MGYLVTETTETGDLIKDYIWMEGMSPVAQIDNDTVETITYLHTDHLMTARLATDELQTVTWRWEGEAFGNTPAQELAGINVNLRFPGQYFDQETQLHYNHFRYYDSTLGRYITADPIGIMGGLNLYSYSQLNPITFIDPRGLKKVGGRGGNSSQAGSGNAPVANLGGCLQATIQVIVGASIGTCVITGTDGQLCTYSFVCLKIGFFEISGGVEGMIGASSGTDQMGGFSGGLSGSVGMGPVLSGGGAASGSGATVTGGPGSGGIAFNISLDLCMWSLVGCECR